MGNTMQLVVMAIMGTLQLSSQNLSVLKSRSFLFLSNSSGLYTVSSNPKRRPKPLT